MFPQSDFDRWLHWARFWPDELAAWLADPETNIEVLIGQLVNLVRNALEATAAVRGDEDARTMTAAT